MLCEHNSITWHEIAELNGFHSLLVMRVAFLAAVTSTGTGAVTSTGVGAVTSTGVGAACKKLTKIQNIETQFATVSNNC